MLITVATINENTARVLTTREAGARDGVRGKGGVRDAQGARLRLYAVQ